MKTRYWKQFGSDIPDWKWEGDALFVHNGEHGWAESMYSTPEEMLELDRGPGIHECTEDGTPLSEIPADRLTLAEFDAFAARVRANLALLEKEGER